MEVAPSRNQRMRDTNRRVRPSLIAPQRTRHRADLIFYPLRYWPNGRRNTLAKNLLPRQRNLSIEAASPRKARTMRLPACESVEKNSFVRTDSLATGVMARQMTHHVIGFRRHQGR